MIILACIEHSCLYETECVTRLFFPGDKIFIAKTEPDHGLERHNAHLSMCAYQERWLADDADNHIITRLERKDDALHLSVDVRLSSPVFSGRRNMSLPLDSINGALERGFGVMLYELLSSATGVVPPWGILTGVRPVRFCRSREQQGLGSAEIRTLMTQDYLVQPRKADLALSVLEAQRAILAGNTPDSFSLYISIPFCPSRCLYCSFVSADIEKKRALVPEYLRLLIQELSITAEIAANKGLKLHTIYMGGGTPTSLSAEQLREIFSAVASKFDMSDLIEYTVEAGRPDTITAEKLAVMRDFGIDRISINPQTLDDTILENIGRNHTAAQTLKSFNLARDMGFSMINMDLIAGLPGETPENFDRTLKTVLKLRPENLTLHTLTVKRSSTLRGQDDAFAASGLPLDVLLETAAARVYKAGYSPYYMYRQKSTVQNLENIGYTLPGAAGVYNVYSMEDVHTVLAAGAGSVTKLCGGEGRVQRVFAYKYPSEYITGFDEILARKNTLTTEWML